MAGKVGQPTVMTPETLELLKEAFLLGCSDREACHLANISTSTLYHYQEANPRYAEQKEIWKDSPTLIARRSVVNALENDYEHALKYLERKKKDEFSPRSEHTGADGKDMAVTFAWVGEEKKEEGA